MWQARVRASAIGAKRALRALVPLTSPLTTAPALQRYEESATLPAARDDVKRMFRKGVPLKLRAKAWSHVGAADTARAAAGAGHYTALCSRDAASAEELEAEVAALHRDLPAHLAEHPTLRAGPGAEALTRVTRALVRAAPAGSFAPASAVDARAVAAFALLVYGTEPAQEEAAFWAARVALSALAPPEAPPHSLLGLAVEARTLDNLLTVKAPRVAEKMRALNVHCDAFLSDWLLSLFVRSLPAECCARVWDALFCEGPKVLVRYSLALLKAAEPALLAAPDAAAFAEALRTACARSHDRDARATGAFDRLGSLPHARLEQLRKAAAEELAAERAEASSRRASHSGANGRP